MFLGQEAYFDIAVKNTGNQPVTAFCVSLWADTSFLGQFCRASNDTLYPGDTAIWVDQTFSFQFPADSVEIWFEIDPQGLLFGEDIADNVFYQTFEWKAPNLKPEFWYLWPQPIVASNGRNDHTLDPLLFANDSIFFDACWSNSTTMEVNTPFTTRLSVDGNTVQLAETAWLGITAVNRVDSLTDLATLLGPNWHVCSLHVDYNDDIVESNEEDNVYVCTLYVELPWVVAEGAFDYRDRNFRWGQSGHYVPGDGFRVEMWEVDSSGSEILSDLIINDPYNGEFSFPSYTNIDPEDGSRRDLYLKFVAASPAAWGFVGANLADTFSFVSDTVFEVPNGYHDFGSWIPRLSEGGLFYAIDYMEKARNYWIDLTGLIPDPVAISLIATQETGYYSVPGVSFIVFDSLATVIGDEVTSFNKWIVCHEYGHFLQDTMSFLEPGYPYGHLWGDSTCDSAGIFFPCPASRIANESFSNLLSCSVLDTSIYRHIFLDSLGTFTWNLTLQLDSGVMRIRHANLDSRWDTLFNNLGSRVEASVSGLLWDLKDAPNDDLPPMIQITQWPPTYNDGIGDSLTVPMADIVSKFLNTPAGYVQPKDIFEYYVAWLTDPYQDHPKALHDVYYEHGIDINESCCLGVTGNVDGDPDEMITLTDITILVQSVFVTFDFASLACQGEANASGDTACDLTLTDITRLINHLFNDIHDLSTCLEFDANLCNNKNVAEPVVRSTGSAVSVPIKAEPDKIVSEE